MLQESGLFASKEEVEHREKVLDKLRKLTTLWIKEAVIKKRKVPATVDENAMCKIYTSGFYRLDAHMKDAVVETLCLASYHVERKEFFTSFVAFLRKQSGITDVLVAEEAYVPFIQMSFDKIKLKMVFACTTLRKILTDVCLRDTRLLHDMEVNCIRSLNSCSMIDEILHLVPNRETFRCALHAIIMWAKKQGVYCDLPGYFGGISWAILVAKTCQLYPNAVASTIVHRFFLVCSYWHWPKPILLKEPERNVLNLHVWDPQVHELNSIHPMPIITPSYPHQNAVFNISKSDCVKLLKCFQNALSTVNGILNENDSWIKLYESANFFSKYKNFLHLTVSSVSKNEHYEWCQLVEPKIQFLVRQIEKQRIVQEVHSSLEAFTPLEMKPGMHQSMWFVGLELKTKTEAENLNLTSYNLNLTSDIQSFYNALTRRAWAAGAFPNCMDIDIQHVKRKELYKYLPTSVIGERKKKETASKSSSGVKENSCPEPTNAEEIVESNDSDQENSILIGNDNNIARKRIMNVEENDMPCAKRVFREPNTL